MDSTPTSFDLLRQLESRHDELLARLDELDKRVEKTLMECQLLRGGGNEGMPATTLDAPGAGNAMV
jgi:hypothetical protein